MVPTTVLTQSKPVSITVVRPVSAAMPKIKVTRPRHANPVVTKTKSPIRRHLTRSPSPMTNNSPPKVTAVKALVVSAAQVNVSPSRSAQSRKQDDKTKKEAKGKSHIESFTRNRDLIAEFEDYFDHNINEVNDVGTIVPTVRQNSLNITNTFSAVGPSNAAASPTYGKSSFIDAF
nr:hypothetical protein [Tanacetum cinerariifolium]